MRRLLTLLTLLTLLLAAAPAAATPGADGAGAIHGTVRTDDGTVHTGFLRLGNWDTWWDDVLTAERADWPWAAHVDVEELARERRADYFASNGLIKRLAFVLGGGDRDIDSDRLFLCRYGQIARIAIDRDGVTVETTDGGSHRMRGRSRDLRGDLTVADSVTTELDFADVKEIVFAAAPAGSVPPWRRLAGTVTVRDGKLAGFVQWDASESTDLDELDGEDRDGDHALPMGDIAAIAKDRDGSLVTLRDGRTLHLTGTNDVNADNRGIGVEVAGLGRVEVPWRHFVRVDFAEPGPSGPGRPAYVPGRQLTGSATDRDGRTHRGRLAYDLDEGWTWDLFNGASDGIEYTIPFAALAAVEPLDGGCRVTLGDGLALEMDHGQDAAQDNHGLLVLGEGAPVRIPWRRLAMVRFDR